MKAPFLVALCLIAAASISEADEPARDITAVAPASLLDGFESRPELRSWLEFWKTQVPDLSLDSFALAGSMDFITVVTQDYNLPPSLDSPSISQRAAFSPDSLWALDQDPDDDPDTFMNLIDVRAGIGVRVIQCGTPCHFSCVAWLDNERVAVVGMIETGMRGEYLSPGIYVVDNRSRTINGFFGPGLVGERRHACRVAWQEWQKQHRAK